jgi:hypothetical protein
VFERVADDAVVYRTGRSDFALLPLVRTDGVPTQHMRTIAYWIMTKSEITEASLIRICGEEWRPHTLSTKTLIPALMPRTPGQRRPATIMFHRMVTMNSEVVKSSRGAELLVDDLLKQIEASVSQLSVSRACARSRAQAVTRASLNQASLHPAHTAALVALGYFLTRPLTAAIDFEPDRLLRTYDSFGWQLALARSQASGEPTSARDDTGEDSAYRFAALQADVLDQHLRVIVARHDIVPFAQCLNRLVRWYLQREHSPRVARVVTSIFEHGSLALGLKGPSQ